MKGSKDETVITRRRTAPVPRPTRRWGRWLAIGVVVVAALASGAGLMWLREPPVAPIPMASEYALRAEVPATLTMTRFAANPAVVVLDFPTLAEQGGMLNRLAAWAEKNGVDM